MIILTKDINYDFETKKWKNAQTGTSISTSEWIYGPSVNPILNDVLAIVIQENFNAKVTADWSLRSSNFCYIHRKNGLSCTSELGPQQGLGNIFN